MVAGGIGQTPFLAWREYLGHRRTAIRPARGTQHEGHALLRCPDGRVAGRRRGFPAAGRRRALPPMTDGASRLVTDLLRQVLRRTSPVPIVTLRSRADAGSGRPWRPPACPARCRWKRRWPAASASASLAWPRSKRPAASGNTAGRASKDPCSTPRRSSGSGPKRD